MQSARQAWPLEATAFCWRVPLRGLAFAAAILACVPAAAQPGDALTGLWLTEPGDKGGRAHVQVTRRGDEYVGRIVWLEQPTFPSGLHQGQPRIDLDNPDEALRSRPVLGLEIVSGMTYEGDGRWRGGTIYDPANGKTYRATMALDGAGDDTLDVRGFVGIPLFGRTTTWQRVE